MRYVSYRVSATVKSEARRVKHSCCRLLVKSDYIFVCVCVCVCVYVCMYVCVCVCVCVFRAFAGGISLVVLAVGSTAPGLLQFAIDKFSLIFPDYKERVIKHGKRE